jgi:hypothetical protein
VVIATRGHVTLAGLVLGLAVGTKEWALIAVAPVLFALPDGRRRATLLAIVVAAALTLPGVIGDPAKLIHSGRYLANRHLVNPFSIWWPLGRPLHVLGTTANWVRALPLGLTRLRLAAVLAGGGALIAAGVWIAGRGRVRVNDPMALLALLGLIRFVGDPLPQEYYVLAALIPLLAWETLAARRLPLVTAASTVFVGLIPADKLHLGNDLTSAILITCAVTLGAYLIYRALRDPAVEQQPAIMPAWAERLRERQVTFVRPISRSR